MTRRFWTVPELRQLAELYPDMRNEDIGRILRRSTAAVLHRAKKEGLKKSDRFVATQSGRWHSGQTPWNKGIRWSPSGSEETRFKPGQKPHNTLPLGTERINPDGVLERKVAETGVKRTDWRPVKDLVWEAAHGPIPADHIVICTDRNDIRPETLRCCTRAEQMAVVSVHRTPGRASEVQRENWRKRRETPFAKFIALHLP